MVVFDKFRYPNIIMTSKVEDDPQSDVCTLVSSMEAVVRQALVTVGRGLINFEVRPTLSR